MNPLWILAALAVIGKKKAPVTATLNPGNPGSLRTRDDPLDRL